MGHAGFRGLMTGPPALRPYRGTPADERATVSQDSRSSFRADDRATCPHGNSLGLMSGPPAIRRKTITAIRPINGYPVTICGTRGLSAIPQKPTAMVLMDDGIIIQKMITPPIKYPISQMNIFLVGRRAASLFLISLIPRNPREAIKYTLRQPSTRNIPHWNGDGEPGHLRQCSSTI